MKQYYIFGICKHPPLHGVGDHPVSAAIAALQALYNGADYEFMMEPVVRISINPDPSARSRSDVYISSDRYVKLFPFLYDGARTVTFLQR